MREYRCEKSTGHCPLRLLKQISSCKTQYIYAYMLVKKKELPARYFHTLCCETNSECLVKLAKPVLTVANRPSSVLCMYMCDALCMLYVL